MNIQSKHVITAGLIIAAAIPTYAWTRSKGLVISDMTVSEAEGSVTLTITRPKVRQWTSTNFDVRSGTAHENSDYIRTSVSLTFQPNETTKTVTVPIIADNIVEGPETFTASIYGTNNVQIERGTATVTITDPPSAAPPPEPTPSPTPSDTTTIPASIPSNFDGNPLLVPSWGTGAIAASASPDVVGAFRFICNPSHLAYDDPIVYPGQKGAAHLHQFFGNTAADANSTYTSLRTTGDSTCNNALNRSAYWMPAMLNGLGQVVRPDYISVYYKRRPNTDPVCSDPSNAKYMGQCVPLPRGLRYVFGYNAATGSADVGGGFHWNCDGAGAVTGHFRSIPEAAKGCPNGARLGAVISSPPCWDGKNVDYPDHRSHMAYPSYGSWGYLRCPTTHPFVVPEFTMGVWYTTDSTLNRTGDINPSVQTWYLSSDRNHMGQPLHTPGTTLHADWFGAWDDTVMEMWTNNCINRMLNCSGGDLGNGRQLKNFDGFSWTANPRLVPVPLMPAHH